MGQKVAAGASTQEHDRQVVRHMQAVQSYDEGFRNLQTGWDNLTLLGQLSGTGIDTSNIRRDFHELTGQLIEQLAQEILSKTVLEGHAKAQVAIDILVRNLFERTADIGFLATDQDIRDYLASSAESRAQYHARKELRLREEQLRARFAEYVAKYSVYHDVVLMDTEGNVLVRLDATQAVERSTHALVAEALTTKAAYVESFGAIDLLPEVPRALVYSSRVTDAEGEALGVLCLCFRFDDETTRIFRNLVGAEDWSVITLLDASGCVIASSDMHHVPVGARFACVLDAEYGIQRFAASEYVATTAQAAGYQGYTGPGWFGHVMVPLQHAFETQAASLLENVDPQVLQTIMHNPTLFGEALRNIPERAEEIVRNLNLSIWNGHISMSRLKHTINPTFSRVLLQEVGVAGGRTRTLFRESIADLHETVVSAILQDSAFLASLAMDIMDRNLYERANDCRWWALTGAFRSALSADHLSDEAADNCGQILRYINSLYTVYSQLVLFDTRGRLVASSNACPVMRGEQIGAEWVQRALDIENSQGYVVSEFVPSPLYGDAPTYIYAAAIRSTDGERVVGGVGIVFDSTPQFQAMLQDALPREKSGEVVPDCIGVFVDGEGLVIASTHAGLPAGSKFLPERELCSFSTEARFGIICWQDKFYALGIRGAAGYREFKSADDCYHDSVQAIVMIPVCDSVEHVTQLSVPALGVKSEHGVRDGLELATLRIGDRWMALKPVEIVEAMERRGLLEIPGAGADFAGYLMYRGVPVPVFNIQGMAQAGRVPGASEATQVVLLQRSESSWLGILADELGAIIELSASRMQTVPEMIAGAGVITDAIVPFGDKEQLLPVLSVERIARRLGANHFDKPLSEITPLRVANRA
ncbi:chemotaxis protein CheW [Uliginosibacterium sp. H3]|uniref:Chemotaxis protein CheW n=1 Tax=Uliginosibacterium silvisoli TaxID=3114758 RepID=A0ABU6JYQ1_9RHOO|nr:chemotaxis protein CheW [Uliginosibacterium sp. H3]